MRKETTTQTDHIRQGEERPMVQRTLKVSLGFAGALVLFGTIIAVVAF